MYFFVVCSIVTWSAFNYGMYFSDWHYTEVIKIGVLGIIFVIASIASTKNWYYFAEHSNVKVKHT